LWNVIVTLHWNVYNMKLSLLSVAYIWSINSYYI
jgi:hypothetical protein